MRFVSFVQSNCKEINKLRRKITNTVHILAHVKEKLQFVQVASKEVLKLRRVEMLV